MSMNKPTEKELERGYSQCKDCDQGIHLHQSGFECDTHMCSQCKCHVADKEEFFKFKSGIEVLSK